MSNDSPQLPFDTNLVLWGALAVSQVIYLFVPEFVDLGRDGPPEALSLALAAVAVVEAIGVVVYFRQAALGPVQRGVLDPKSAGGAPQLFQVFILCWVLAESIAIFALVLGVLGAELVVRVPFVIGAAGLLFVCRPWHPGLEAPVSLSDTHRPPPIA
jgi:hypothetical protein